MVTSYGTTETCGGCVYDGAPLDGIVAVRRGRPDPAGRAGAVLRYRGRPDLTAAALDGGWFVTSDLGDLDGSGRLTVRGRADGMINTGGEKVAADEVAGALAACPGVREAAVAGRPDPEWGELVTAIVVPADPAAPPSLDGLRAALRGTLAPFAVPRALVLVPAVRCCRRASPTCGRCGGWPGRPNGRLGTAAAPARDAFRAGLDAFRRAGLTGRRHGVYAGRPRLATVSGGSVACRHAALRSWREQSAPHGVITYARASQ